jgi:hypothetical protein
MSFCRERRNRRFAFARVATPFSRMIDRYPIPFCKVIDEAWVIFIPLVFELVPIRDRLPTLISATGEISLVFLAGELIIEAEIDRFGMLAEDIFPGAGSGSLGYA